MSEKPKSLRLWSDFAEEGRPASRGPRYRSLGAGLYDGQRCCGYLDSAALAEHCARLLNQAAVAAEESLEVETSATMPRAGARMPL